jgi:uncharacterized protein (DUF2141 family)
MRAASMIGGAMIVLATGLAAPAIAAPCHGTPTAYKLVVVATNVHSDRGRIAVTLYGDDKHKFLKDEGEVQSWFDPAHKGETSICMWLPKPGAYAAVVYHDANANGDLDTGLLGIPTEGYGFSNNVRPVLKAPSFDSAKFAVTAGETQQRIRLNYP